MFLQISQNSQENNCAGASLNAFFIEPLHFSQAELNVYTFYLAMKILLVLTSTSKFLEWAWCRLKKCSYIITKQSFLIVSFEKPSKIHLVRGVEEIIFFVFYLTHFVLADVFLEIASPYYSPNFSKNFIVSFHIVISMDLGHR